jgi:hypothetical protein
MAKILESPPTIVGNIPILPITVNTKGGSVTAILRQEIRGRVASHAFGAKMEFEPGLSCILVAPGVEDMEVGKHAQGRFRVQRISPHRYIVELEDNEEEVIDPLTRATLTVLEEQLKAKKMKLLSDNDARQRLSAARRRGAKVIAEAKQKLSSSNR